MTTTEPMIDRIARVIEAKSSYIISQHFAKALARTVIVTMREHTHLMEDSGIAAFDEAVGDNDVKREHLVAAYQAMIDAALRL